MPPGRKMLITDWALALAAADSACNLNKLPRVRPKLPTKPTKRNSRRLGCHRCSRLLQNEPSYSCINFAFDSGLLVQTLPPGSSLQSSVGRPEYDCITYDLYQQ